jgi:hypothetical protein
MVAAAVKASLRTANAFLYIRYDKSFEVFSRRSRYDIVRIAKGYPTFAMRGGTIAQFG